MPHYVSLRGWPWRLSALLSVLLLVGTVWLAAIAFNVYAVNLWLTGLHAYAT